VTVRILHRNSGAGGQPASGLLIRGSRRFPIFQCLQGFFLIAGILVLSYAAYTYAARYVFQSVERWKFDRGPARSQGRSAPEPMPEPVLRVAIPRLRIAAMVREGIDDRTLNLAIGHIPFTALPGRPGNVGLAAHRDTLFRSLMDVRQDDQITLSTLHRDYSYRVVWYKVVKPTAVDVLEPVSGEETLTLVTCYPFYFVGNAPKRFVVRARRVYNQPSALTPALY
jgi:sortase A